MIGRGITEGKGRVWIGGICTAGARKAAPARGAGAQEGKSVCVCVGGRRPPQALVHSAEAALQVPPPRPSPCIPSTLRCLAQEPGQHLTHGTGEGAHGGGALQKRVRAECRLCELSELCIGLRDQEAPLPGSPSLGQMCWHEVLYNARSSDARGCSAGRPWAGWCARRKYQLMLVPAPCLGPGGGGHRLRNRDAARLLAGGGEQEGRLHGALALRVEHVGNAVGPAFRQTDRGPV